MKSESLIKHESKPDNSAGHHNYQKSLIVDENSLHPTTDSNAETNRNISSEQKDATLTVIPVS